jgi:hypothetical protein
MQEFGTLDNVRNHFFFVSQHIFLIFKKIIWKDTFEYIYILRHIKFIFVRNELLYY